MAPCGSEKILRAGQGGPQKFPRSFPDFASGSPMSLHSSVIGQDLTESASSHLRSSSTKEARKAKRSEIYCPYFCGEGLQGNLRGGLPGGGLPGDGSPGGGLPGAACRGRLTGGGLQAGLQGSSDPPTACSCVSLHRTRRVFCEQCVGVVENCLFCMFCPANLGNGNPARRENHWTGCPADVRGICIRDEKEDINIDFLFRISRGHSRPPCPDAQGSKSLSPPSGPQENAFFGGDVYDFRSRRP